MKSSEWGPPEPGDIVWCHFPERPRDVPGPKPRPALVLTVTEHEDGVAVQVAYGTSQKLARMLAGEFAIRKYEHHAAFAMSGLSFDTKFDLGRVLELPWNADFFGVPPAPRLGQNPKLGSLHIGMRQAVAAAAHAAKK